MELVVEFRAEECFETFASRWQSTMSQTPEPDTSDEELWDAFLNATISEEDWTHRAHVRVAFLHMKKFPFEEALVFIRQRIQAVNLAHGTPEAIDRGYHETITRAFLHLIAAAAQESTFSCSEEFCDQHPQLMTKRVLLNYYSRDRIMSADAKASFTSPDLCELPDLAE